MLRSGDRRLEFQVLKLFVCILGRLTGVRTLLASEEVRHELITRIEYSFGYLREDVRDEVCSVLLVDDRHS